MNRRDFFKTGTAAMLATAFPSLSSAWSINQARVIKLYNVNTKEKIETPFWRNGYYDSDGILRLTKFFRDWRQGEIHNINTDVFEIIYAIQNELDLNERGLHLVSGYRSKKTNDALRRANGSRTGVAKRSYHMEGKAADIRSYDVNLRKIYKAAQRLKEGGVGYYPRSHFVHIDVGNVRYW